MSENNVPESHEQPAPKKKGSVSVIHRINYLREKAGGSRHGSGSGKLDERVIAKAQAAVNNYAPAYPAMVSRDLDGLIRLVDQLDKTPADQQKKILHEIAVQANEVQSLGGTFGYDLVSIIGRSLRVFADGLETTTKNHTIIIHAHVDTLRVVLAQKIKGYGDNLGAALLTELVRVLEKNGGHDAAGVINESLHKMNQAAAKTSE